MTFYVFWEVAHVFSNTAPIESHHGLIVMQSTGLGYALHTLCTAKKLQIYDGKISTKMYQGLSVWILMCSYV